MMIGGTSLSFLSSLPEIVLVLLNYPEQGVEVEISYCENPQMQLGSCIPRNLCPQCTLVDL